RGAQPHQDRRNSGRCCLARCAATADSASDRRRVARIHSRKTRPHQLHHHDRHRHRSARSASQRSVTDETEDCPCRRQETYQKHMRAPSSHEYRRSMVVLVVVLLVLLIAVPIAGWALWLLISTVVVGAIIGGLARLVIPGRQDIGILATIVIGWIGS